ncbi:MULTISPECIES: prolipoprotein diacylglyceryl transferase [Dethiosulfovibrio]|uniref:Prolipoprotein diacylglyceryl transferase n=2 Tax=Dethiosulfovibrio TaxID=47054 RepID=A0ABS9EM01_9BACT|nr:MULTISPECIES: prolipoprotein diacylglyceryl transferase [Dethiosulfovibrio]MCF4113087.1 prolipoprotein diacylglyceryl transferase [Dethiosulfovibrio russensis]MCF4141551.1 prolipoprotein diacylglyceryl transferase [Dethiosulfovibrio marinus]MCF4144508.1 prolipoprotein diacylglyceryl transferase [Dethiosulfovibrio acidaminovorans]
MHPVLFYIGSVPVHSYYVLWTAGLWIALFWTRSRAEKRYLVDPDDLHHVLIWSFIAMLLGARIGGYFDNWSIYAQDPSRIWRIWEGGMSSMPAAISCGLAGIWLCRRKGIEVWRLAEAASVPTMACIAVGRWGCFLNGCCHGVATTCPLAVKFPRLPLPVHPTQLYYSFGALAIAMLLWSIEGRIGAGDRKTPVAVLWPLLMVLYGAERFFVDILRDGDRIMGFKVGQGLGFLVALAGILWLSRSLSVVYVRSRTQKG